MLVVRTERMAPALVCCLPHVTEAHNRHGSAPLHKCTASASAHPPRSADWAPSSFVMFARSLASCGTRPGPAVADCYGAGLIAPICSSGVPQCSFLTHPSSIHSISLPSINSVHARPPRPLLTRASIQPTRPQHLRGYDKHRQRARSGEHQASHARTLGSSLPSTRSQIATHPGSVHVSHYYGTIELAPSR